MFSYEIDTLLRNKEYIVTMDDYKKIIASSQITYIKYDPYDDSFVISTDDKYSWRFRVT